MRSDLLHVIAVVSNPIRYQSRYRLFQEFQAKILKAGVPLYVVECAYGDRPFEVIMRTGILGSPGQRDGKQLKPWGA